MSDNLVSEMYDSGVGRLGYQVKKTRHGCNYLRASFHSKCGDYLLECRVLEVEPRLSR